MNVSWFCSAGFAANRRLATALLLAVAFGLPGAARAQWLTQSITLKPGWNAVYLQVDASYTNLDTLLPDINGPISDVWLWQPPLSTLQYISTPATPNASGSQWAVWTVARGDTDTLGALRANGAYLVNNRTATNYVWSLKGRVVPPNYQWTTTGLNFLGFPTPAASAPNFSTYLKPAPGLDLALSPGNSSHVFRYPGGALGATNPVEVLPAAAASTLVNRGEAFWIGGSTNTASAYYNTYYGPIEVRLQSIAGIDYSDLLGTYSVRLRNVTSTNRTAVLTLVSSEAAPTGQPVIAAAPQLLVRGAINPITLTYAFSVLGSPGQSFPLAPAGQVGSEVQVVLGLNRQAMMLPPGSRYATILRVTDANGLQQVDVPVTATVPTAAGLWVGQATVDRVGQYLKSYPAVDPTATNQAAQVNAAAAASGALPNGVESAGAQWLLREANATPVTNAVRNPSFEANIITTAPGYGTIANWTGGNGLNPVNGADYVTDNGRIPDGGQVAFLQSDGTLSQTLSNVVVGQTYRLHYYENARHCCDAISVPTCRVTVGGEFEESQLTGTNIGYLHGQENSSHGLATAFDGNASTFVDAGDDDVNADDNWVGLDFGSGYVLTAVAYQPPSGKESRMVNGKMQGANTKNFSDAVDLLVITAPPLAALTRVNLTAPTAYQYVRYLSPDHGQGNIAELQFFGRDPAVTSTDVVALHQVLPVGNAGDHTVPYHEVYSDPFVALSSNLQLTFTKGSVAVAIGQPYPDVTLLLDNISLVPPQIKSYIAVASSVDGYNLVAADTGVGTNGGLLYVSTDGGNSWAGRAVSNRWSGVASSQDGGVIAATVNNGSIYVSTDFGTTWNVRATNLGAQAWSGLAMSADGLQMAAVVNGGRFYTSANAGQTWVTNTAAGLRAWSGVALSADGTTLLAATSPGNLYVSRDSGSNWVARGDSSYWAAVGSSANGTNLAAAVNGGQIYTSTDAGQNWAAKGTVNYWSTLAYSLGGRRIVAAANPGQIYTSDDSGATWTNRFDTRAWTGLAASGDGRHVVAVAGGTAAGGILYTLNRDFITYVVNPDNGLVTDNRGGYLISGVQTNLAAVGRPFPLRLILHNPASGNDPKLFQRVFVGLDSGSNTVVANRENLLNAAQLASARRISATHLPFTTNNLYWTSAGTFDPGSSLGFQVNLSYKDQANNPYLHTFHPDHDNLDVNFQTVLPAGVESFDINRALQLTFSAAGTNFESLTASAYNRGGVYEETMVVAGGGKNTRTFHYTGSFNLQRISSVTNLVINIH